MGEEGTRRWQRKRRNPHISQIQLSSCWNNHRPSDLPPLSALQPGLVIISLNISEKSQAIRKGTRTLDRKHRHHHKNTAMVLWVLKKTLAPLDFLCSKTPNREVKVRGEKKKKKSEGVYCYLLNIALCCSSKPAILSEQRAPQGCTETSWIHMAWDWGPQLIKSQGQLRSWAFTYRMMKSKWHPTSAQAWKKTPTGETPWCLPSF